ncbi:hypothetical protein EBH_0049710 [Eimeria brunetti]|uniref:Uncharacterized protein n=1 Tax=Eimeria brunetti TaxID=51314 RepID=U6M2J0_9EIME|nr:hypothetical protein EBH_0049710 [Eimeria brunetti]
MRLSLGSVALVEISETAALSLQSPALLTRSTGITKPDLLCCGDKQRYNFSPNVKSMRRKVIFLACVVKICAGISDDLNELVTQHGCMDAAQWAVGDRSIRRPLLYICEAPVRDEVFACVTQMCGCLAYTEAVFERCTMRFKAFSGITKHPCGVPGS